LPSQSIGKASKLNVYGVINNDEVREVVTLHVNNMTCFFKHGKQITARYNVSDLFTNGILDLGQIFQRLKMQAGIYKISQLKVAPREKIFEKVSMDDLKNMCNKTLKSLRVALLNPVTIIYTNISQRSSTRRSHWHN